MNRTRSRMLRTIEYQLFDIVLQPVISLISGRAVGYEALSRFAGGSPTDWFSQANSLGLGVELELAALHKAMRVVDAVAPAHVSVNLSALAIADSGLWDVLGSSIDSLPRLVIELTEHDRVLDYEEIGFSLDGLRDRGVRLAVDDAGSGYSSFRHILRLHPDFIKLDRELIAGINADSQQRSLVAALSRFAKEVGASVIAEGVETPEEAAILLPIGIHLAQGFLFARPGPVELVRIDGPATGSWSDIDVDAREFHNQNAS
jgi:EAL domain-containing protein (putative c-di-GMP-specific phosphodiesterase class I)